MKRLLFASYFFIFIAFSLFSYKVYSKNISSTGSFSENTIAQDSLDEKTILAEVQPEVEEPLEPPEPIEVWETYTIRSGDTLGSILRVKKISTPEVLSATKELYDLSKIRIGKKIEFLRHRDHVIPYMTKVNEIQSGDVPRSVCLTEFLSRCRGFVMLLREMFYV